MQICRRQVCAGSFSCASRVLPRALALQQQIFPNGCRQSDHETIHQRWLHTRWLHNRHRSKPHELSKDHLLVRVPPGYELHQGQVHCILGRNASGKSMLLRKIERAASCSDSAAGSSSSSSRVKCVVRSLSLDAHARFVQQHGEKLVANVLGGIGSPKARDLIVRLGLYPVWDSHVGHLSTGELRKLMLACALLARPKAQVLILDQPFDGLDAHARDQLVYLLHQLTKGFTRLLVDTGGRNRASAYKTQVVYVANRLDQVVGDILTHVVLLSRAKDQDFTEEQQHRQTPRLLQPKVQMWQWAHQQNDQMMARLKRFLRKEAEQVTAMTDDEMVSLVKEVLALSPAADQQTQQAMSFTSTVAIELRDFSISYGKRKILDATTMAREAHQLWALLGPNGCGKSSFSRVLLDQMQQAQLGGSFRVFGREIARDTDSSKGGLRIDAVSTNSHLEMMQLATEHKWSTMQVFCHGDGLGESDAATAASLALRLVGLVQQASSSDSLLQRQFAVLSQGEQRLVLIARALAKKPHVLVLDEITHGLDHVNRQHVLRVVNCVGMLSQQNQLGGHRVHLIMITHYEEEIPACFEHRCRLINHQLIWDHPK